MIRKLPEKFTDLLDVTNRWPKKGDRLLRRSDDWDRGVSFAKDPISRHAHIWSGYMSAGAALIEACDEYTHERHFMIYPILFNYRHGVELAMKWIVTMYGGKTTDEIAHHDLWQLWKLCKKVIEECGSEDGSVEVVEPIIKEFHDLDKTALAFRYWSDKNGTLIELPDGMIDLANLRDVMEGVENFFEGADAMLSELRSAAGW